MGSFSTLEIFSLLTVINEGREEFFLFLRTRYSYLAMFEAHAWKKITDSIKT